MTQMASQEDGAVLYRDQIDEKVARVFELSNLDFKREMFPYASIFHFRLEEGRYSHISKLKVFYEDFEYKNYEFFGFELKSRDVK